MPQDSWVLRLGHDLDLKGNTLEDGAQIRLIGAINNKDYAKRTWIDFCYTENVSENYSNFRIEFGPFDIMLGRFQNNTITAGLTGDRDHRNVFFTNDEGTEKLDIRLGYVAGMKIG